MSDIQSDLQNFIITNFSKESSSTLNDSLCDSSKKINDLIKDSVVVNDAYGNPVTSTGVNDKIAEYDSYGLSNNTLNYPLWLALYNDSWVFKRAIDKPARDMIRCGITINGNNDYSEIYKQIKKKSNELIHIVEWGRLFGGSVGVMMFDTMEDQDYRFRLDEQKIKSAKVMRIYVTDRWYGCSPTYDDTVQNMKDMDFGKPKFYDITFADGKQIRVHHDFVIRFENREAPKLIKNGALQGWGYAEGSHIFNELMRDDQLKTSIQSLINKSLIEVVKMSGMRGVFMSSDPNNEIQLKKRLEMVNWARNYNSLTFLDKEDEYSMNTFSGLSGLSDILQQNMWQIAAALEMQGVLFGDMKSGFANDTDALERYDETILGLCESYLRPVYDKLLKVLFLMQGISNKDVNANNVSIDYTFNSLIAKKRNEEQMMSMKNFNDMVISLLDSGILDTKLAAKAIKKYTLDGVIDLGLTDEEIDKLEDKTMNELEDINLDEE